MEPPAGESLPALDERRPTLPAGPSRDAVSHNLQGQRLGRKGRDTRERIIAAAQDILAEPLVAGRSFTLSEVARRAKLRVGSLYLYFSDLTELLLALLQPVMDSAEEDFVRLLRPRWPDEELEERALEFVNAYYAFWVKHAWLLHLRNSLADNLDERMMRHRVRSAKPLMQLLVEQMGVQGVTPTIPMFSMATALMTGLERVATVTTDPNLPTLLRTVAATHQPLLQAEARLIQLAVGDYRQLAARGRPDITPSCRQSP